MKKPVKIKDPIYGYIEISDKGIYEVINSPLFHRLQDIIQTSYSSVYPSSVHNRFIHSIGVYYLGTLAVKGIKNNSECFLKKEIEEYSATFLLACLLHDLGHAPFSHTGEVFFETAFEEDTTCLKKRLRDELNDPVFVRDAAIVPTGAPHETMSALEAIIYFKNSIKKEHFSFFVRCIIGLRYSDKNDIRNCFIELLNSKTIDVDKLDYLIRDSYYTGFKTVTIDYQRLLASVCFIKKEGELKQGFTKAALSTLESVILAHDMERKWLQNHPAIQYENCLLHSVITEVIDFHSKNGVDLFSLEALTEEGIEISPNYKPESVVDSESLRIRLLSDSDIISTAKMLYDKKNMIKEYFNRSLRKKALWKSEAEYRILFEQAKLSVSVIKQLEKRFDSILSILSNYPVRSGFPLIDQGLLDYMESEINNESKDKPDLMKARIINIKEAIELIEQMKAFSLKKGYKFEYVLISSKQFCSGFNKEELHAIPIKFDNKVTNELGKSINLFEQAKPRDKFFYIYVNPESRDKFDVIGFRDLISDYAYKNCTL